VVVGKGDADGRDIHLADILKQKPFIYPIAFKSAVFSMLLISVYLFEEVLVGLWNGKTFADSMPVIGGGSLKGILFVGITMFVVLMPFFALREVARDIGAHALYEAFFIRRTKFVPFQ